MKNSKIFKKKMISQTKLNQNLNRNKSQINFPIIIKWHDWQKLKNSDSNFCPKLLKFILNSMQNFIPKT